MKQYKYIFATGGLISGAIIGYGVGWFFYFGFFYLFGLFGVESFGGGGIMAYFGFVFAFLPLALFYALPIIGAIRGWKYGYQIGKKKDDELIKSD